MMLDKTLQRIKNELRDTFKNVNPVDRPGLAVIINEDDEPSCRCATILMEDCEDVGYNWFLTKINSNTDELFVRRMIDDYIETEDVTILLVVFPLPEKNADLELELKNLREDSNYEKLNTLELINGVTTFGARITVLGTARDRYNADKY